MANDSTAKAIIKNLKIPFREVKKLAKSIVSIKVHGIKPENKELYSKFDL